MSEDQQIPSSYAERFRLIKLGLLPKEAIAKKKQPIKRISDKKKIADAEEKAARGGESTDLQKWYQKIMDSEVAKCWETGEAIDKNDKFGWHGSIAHILPKELFPSVATHPMNYMILKMWGGTHGTYDSNWEAAAKMKVWKYAIKTIVNILYPALTPEERRKLPDIIIQEIPPEKFLKNETIQ